MTFKAKRTVFIRSLRKRLKGTKCPRCGEKADGATKVCFDSPGRFAGPKPGDVAVCAYCGSVNCYTEGLQLREATPKELREIQGSRHAETVALLMQAALEKRKWGVKK